MADYNLSTLSPRSFEQLIQALAAKVLGPGIVVFGDGPDGGREATFERKVPYPTHLDGWDGYGVVQAKFRQRSGNVYEDGLWAVEQLRDELQKYTDPDTNIRSPDFFIYATNVVLTPVKDKGSKDKAFAVLKEFKSQSHLKDYAIWDYDQIRIFLDIYPEVRTTYSTFITPGDVLAAAFATLKPASVDMHTTMTRFLEKELLSDEYVNLEQAGHTVNEPIPLATVFVDLPIQHEPNMIRSHMLGEALEDLNDVGRPQLKEGFIRNVLAASSERLDPASVGASPVPDRIEAGLAGASRGRFVLIGGPGQGKTTLTQFICQIFRAAVIARKPEHTWSPPTKGALGTIQHHCESENISHKVVPRFPFKLTLNDFAKALAPSSESPIYSVLGYLSSQIKRRTDAEVSPADLRQFLAVYPSVFIFDGLDEVPPSSNRDEVLRAIREFWVDASSANADILSIATSRPQGYNEDFSPLYYQHQHLAELSEQLGWHYAQRLAAVRYGADEDRKEKVLGRLRRAFGDPSTSRLMRTPLQVTIMTALVDRLGQPPQARWNLFNSYYDVIYDREMERDISASRILSEYEPDIRTIHNQVGLILQVDSERTGRTDALLDRHRFVSLVEARLRAEEHPEEDRRTIAEQIVAAASERLVFLVEMEAERIGFEIRSLQEFMAAESLVEDTYPDIQARLEEIAPIPFWRNVFLFAAGKCFAQRQELRELVHSTCAALNEEDGNEGEGLHLVGADLAIALLEEGSARRQPKYKTLLGRLAIRALDKANPRLHAQLANVYDSQMETIYRDELGLRLTGSDHVKFLGAWNCLLALVANDVDWATDMANSYWPNGVQDQVDILLADTDHTKNGWATEQVLRLIPRTPIGTFVGVFQSEKRRALLERQDVDPTLKAAISILESPRHHGGPRVTVLDTMLSYGPINRLTPGSATVLQTLNAISDWHPSWLPYKWAGRFLEAPSKDMLASTLKAFAKVSFDEDHAANRTVWRTLPWPIVACLESCTDAKKLLELADGAKEGRLGDQDDWITAETRWFDEGIVWEDVLSMADQRLPFDARIGTTGFPVTLSPLKVFNPMFIMDADRRTLEDVIPLFSNLPSGRSRQFVAEVINWLMFLYSFPARLEDFPTLRQTDVDTLEEIYRVLPAGQPVPLHVLANLVSESPTAGAKLFLTVGRRHSSFDCHVGNSSLVDDGVEVLRRAYDVLNRDTAMLPVLGAVAERGQLGDLGLEIKKVEALDKPNEKLAGLLIKLCQQNVWLGGGKEDLISIAQDIGCSRGDAFNRIVNTLENNRLLGDEATGFVIALKALMPARDYRAQRRYVSLLEESLGRRTSRFREVRVSERFGLPEGMIELLGSDG
ncbi:MAG: hypothetical protein OXJ55_06890 [Caldilineaceae bacterium]|nr:hypothetical protein [Caldilineaceae bacterium]MDE0499823.1 hypothetical protein [bacterium]MDE0501699.1 hypothetical protein [bacterium]